MLEPEAKDKLRTKNNVHRQYGAIKQQEQMHSGKRTSGMKPISFRWLLSSGSWKAIIWEKTVKYSAAQTKEQRVNTSAIVSLIPNSLQPTAGLQEVLSTHRGKNANI